MPSNFAPVPAEVWLNQPAAEGVETLLEHSIYLQNYNAVLTLLWIYKATTTDSAEDEDSLLEELDPQGFSLARQMWPR